MSNIRNTKTIIMVGDVTGEAGLRALATLLPKLKTEYRAALTIVNGENAADGFGMNELSAKRIFAAGADIITSGNHIWEKRDFLPYMAADTHILRPANYSDALGSGFCRIEKDGADWLIINLQGREFMTPVDCPFRTFDTIYDNNAVGAFTLVDFHGESGREKEAFAFYTAGRALCVAGTHTHVQTADERVLPGGTAYISDLGMTGAQDSIIGMDARLSLERFKTQILYKLECAAGPAVLQGAAITISNTAGTVMNIERISRKDTF